MSEEDAGEGKNNDDLILDTCIHLTSDCAVHRSQETTKTTPDMRYVIRDVVLLTEDRNLRLKAHTTDIPVNKLSDFVQWAFEK